MAARKQPMFFRSLETLEGLWISTLERAVANRRLLGAGMRWVDLGLTTRHYAASVTAKLAGFWGVPTAAQMRETLEMLQRIEDRLAELEDQLWDRGPRARPDSPGDRP